MAGKTKARADQTRRRILDAALDVFCRKGYSCTTFEDMAAAAGLSKGEVDRHFKTKEALLIELLEYGESMGPDAFESPRLNGRIHG